MKRTRPKIGLVLSSGATRGGFSAGIIKILIQEKIPIDLVVGSSVGALAAIGVACGVLPEIMEDWACNTKARQFIIPNLADELGVFNCQRVIDRGKKVVGDINFSQTLIPLIFPAVDLETGKVVYLNQGKIWNAFKAVVAAPGYFAPLRQNGHHLIDAGLQEPLPIEAVRKMGADIIIAVDQGPRRAWKFKKPEEKVNYLPLPKRIKRYLICLQMFIHLQEMFHRRAIDDNLTNYPPDIILSLDKELEKRQIGNDTGFTDTKPMQKLIRLGEEAANGQIPRIKQLIQDWNN